MSFSRFSELPVELQDLIWESYIPKLTSRTAHFTQLSPMLDAIENISSLKRTRALHTATTATEITTAPTSPDPHYPGFDRQAAFRTLLQTTHGSRTVSLRHPDALSPTTSLTLRENLSSITGLGPGPLPCLPSLRVNTDSDLIILEDGWYKLMKRLPGAPLRDILRQEPVRYLAISQYDDELRLADGVHRLFLAFEHLRVLYVLVPPNLFDESEDTIAYMKGCGRRAGFWSGQREYFEVTPEAEQLSGSERVVALYGRTLAFIGEEVHAFLGREGDPRESLRLMTWRNV